VINKIEFSKRAYRAVLCLLVFVILGLWSVRDSKADGGSPGKRVWATGDAFNTYFLWPQDRDGTAGFRIFHRAKTASRFTPGQWYAGRPLTVGIRDSRIWVFFAQGGCQSYDLQTSRTESRLPVGLQAVSCASEKQNFFILAKASQETQVILSSDRFPRNTKTDLKKDRPDGDKQANLDQQETPEASVIEADHPRKYLNLQKGDLVILTHTPGKENPWESLAPGPLPIGDWDQPILGVAEGIVHLFGLGRAGVSRIRRPSLLMHRKFDQDHWLAPEKLPIKNVHGFIVLTVNRQLRVIVAEGLIQPPMTENHETPSPAANQFRLGLYSQEAWRFLEPLEGAPGSPLTGSIYQLAFAPLLDQNIAVFQKEEDDVIRFRAYSSQGKLHANLEETISIKNLQEDSPFSRLLDPKIEMFVLMCALFLLFLRRSEAFAPLPVLKNEIQLAPLWRRGAAILLDTFPAGCLAILIMVKLFPEIVTDPTFPEMMLQGLNSDNVDPTVQKYSIAWFFCFSWTLVGYMTLCEVFFSTTPGKKALQIKVVNHEGQRPNIRQVLTRNLIRVIELYGNLIFVVLVLLFFTHKRQRLGDLMARTIVVMKNPQPPKQQEDEGDSPSG